MAASLLLSRRAPRWASSLFCCRRLRGEAVRDATVCASGLGVLWGGDYMNIKLNALRGLVLGAVASLLVATSAFAQAADPVASAQTELTGVAGQLGGLVVFGIAGVAAIALAWAAMRIVPKVIRRFT